MIEFEKQDKMIKWNKINKKWWINEKLNERI